MFLQKNHFKKGEFMSDFNWRDDIEDADVMKQRASDFAVSPRGQFIISQALCLALQSMKDRPDVEREFSNEEDMRYLIDNLFPVYEVFLRAKVVR
jgi:hypothetical protein